MQSEENKRNSGPSEGALFSRNYVRPPKKLDDSIRARIRVATLALENFDDWSSQYFAQQIEGQLGVNYPRPYNKTSHRRFFETCELSDFLSSITILTRVVPNSGKTRDECAQILLQEHLRYRLDEKGGVHYLVDEAFEANVAAAIDGLGQPKYGAARAALEAALGCLSGSRPRGKDLIRGVFEAVESAFLTIISSAENRLNEAALKRHLRPMLLERYRAYPDHQDKADRLIKLFTDWVDIAHPLRHATAAEQEHEAPLDYAIMVADQGMALIRLMVTSGDGRPG